MIDPQSMEQLRSQMRERIGEDRALLDELRNEIRPLRNDTRRIQPRSTTAISLVGTDGGNNQLQFDPFLVQLVRVVDSSNNEYCLEVISPTSDRRAINARNIDPSGTPLTSLGRMMKALGVEKLWDLSPAIPRPHDPSKPREPISPSWVQVYRELMEWAVLFKVVREQDFATDTVVICDGNLRSKVFSDALFIKYRDLLKEGIEAQYRKNRRRIYVAGVAKHSKVLQRYRLAMQLESVLRHDYPCYVPVPFEIQRKSLKWQEYARGDEQSEGEANKFVAGKMFLVKFGSRPHDPIWPIDILDAQAADAQAILGYMLADAIDGFPVPFYPRCLQRAHENAALVDFDMDILQQEIVKAMRASLGDQQSALDEAMLVDQDPSAKRYG
jgi:hypothetical protein